MQTNISSRDLRAEWQDFFVPESFRERCVC